MLRWQYPQHLSSNYGYSDASSSSLIPEMLRCHIGWPYVECWFTCCPDFKIGCKQWDESELTLWGQVQIVDIFISAVSSVTFHWLISFKYLKTFYLNFNAVCILHEGHMVISIIVFLKTWFWLGNKALSAPMKNKINNIIWHHLNISNILEKLNILSQMTKITGKSLI